jgi:hypothetical protein
VRRRREFESVRDAFQAGALAVEFA